MRGLVIVLVLLAGATPAVARADGFTKTTLHFDVTIGPAGAQRCDVVGDLYKPDSASAAHPAPAILATNGFGGSKKDFNVLAPSYARRGYVFLAYSGLGFGGSGCKITLDDPDYDGRAGSQLVSFLGGSKVAKNGAKVDYVIRDAVAHDGTHHQDDPRIGMIGGSYGGQIQFAVAGIDSRLDTIIPQITWNDLAYSLTPNNTDFTHGVTSATPGVSKLDWPALFTGLGIVNGVAALGDTSHLGSCPNFDDRVCPGLLVAAAGGYPDATTLALLRHASVSTYMQRIRIPTFLTQGQSDTLFDLQEAVATYKALRAQKTPVKMLWRSSGHSGGGLGKSENNPADPPSAYESRMDLQWFDHYLRRVGRAPALNFSFLRNWIPYKGDAAPALGVAPSYPAAPDTTMYLSGSGGLVGSGTNVKAGSAQMVALPAPPTSSGGGVVDLGTYDPPLTSVAFDSPVLTRDTDVVGIPRVSLRLRAPTFASGTSASPFAKLVVFAKLVDLDPATGRTKLPRNLVSAARVADLTKPVTIELPGIVHRFVKGHRLRLLLTTSDATYRNNNLPGAVSVLTSPQAPSTFSLPIYSPPAARSVLCPRRPRLRVFGARIHRGEHIRSIRVAVTGRRSKVVRGSALRRPIYVRNLPRTAYRVTVTSYTTRGRSIRRVHSYDPCVATAKK